MIVATIPAYHNELDTLKVVIAELHSVLSKYDHEVNVVFDKNADIDTMSLPANLYRQEGKGLADAFRKEMEVAVSYKPDYIIHIDADRQYLASDIPAMMAIAPNCDLVLGSRLRGKIEDMPTSKKIPNELATLGLKMWLRQDITDVTTGLRVFNKDVAALPIKSDYTYTVEQIIRTARNGFTIKSVPVNFLKRDGESRLMRSPLHYIVETLKNAGKVLS